MGRRGRWHREHPGPRAARTIYVYRSLILLPSQGASRRDGKSNLEPRGADVQAQTRVAGQTATILHPSAAGSIVSAASSPLTLGTRPPAAERAISIVDTYRAQRIASRASTPYSRRLVGPSRAPCMHGQRHGTGPIPPSLICPDPSELGLPADCEYFGRTADTPRGPFPGSWLQPASVASTEGTNLGRCVVHAHRAAMYFVSQRENARRRRRRLCRRRTPGT